MLSRQALHAESITLDHPTTGERVTFSSPLPSDIQGVLDGLRKYASVS
jgi:23S rRNA pseudouridine1911/1915/1917 synthase